MPHSARSRLAIGITVYRPDLGLLEELLSKARRMAPLVLLHIDGPTGSAIGPEELERLRAGAGDAGIEIGQSTVNEGIATALNKLAARALGHGCRSLLCFDQDSDPALDLGDRLTEAMGSLKARGLGPAVVGPRPVAREPASKAPHYRARGPGDAATGCQPVDFVITSGSLFDLEVFGTLGLFREEYRIDAVDTEWCFRAWAGGRSVWMLPDAPMPHRIGEGLVRFGPLAFPRQSEQRMETYIRNQARMLRLGYVPWRWKLRTILYVPLQGAIHAGLVSGAGWSAARRFVRAASSGWLARTAAVKMLKP